MYKIKDKNTSKERQSKNSFVNDIEKMPKEKIKRTLKQSEKRDVRAPWWPIQSNVIEPIEVYSVHICDENRISSGGGGYNEILLNSLTLIWEQANN